ncbi:MAG: TRAP transporter substrate-binding protein DctP [Lachnospiraceae bacterium]|nr:TRAP transporter substrate-binding protein DctP [Lachnospiraceae bacterium]
MRKIGKGVTTGVLALLTASLVIGALGGCGKGGTEEEAGSEGEVRTWKMAHTRATGTDNDRMAHMFADKVEAALEGVDITIYPNNELGDYTVVQEAVSLGEVELNLSSLSNGVDPTLSVQIAPYLVTSWEEAYKFYNSEDGIVTDYVKQQLEKQDIKLLAIIPKYFGAVGTTKEAMNPGDPTGSKGVKIRVPQMNSFEKFASGIGFQTTPLAASEIFTALQTKIVEGCCGGGAESYYNDFGELIRYIYPLRTHMENHWLYISMETWNSLTEEEREKVTEIAKELEAYAYDLAQENEEKYFELFRDQGTEVYEFTQQELDAYRAYVRTNVWPELGGEYGEELWNRITAEIGE